MDLIAVGAHPDDIEIGASALICKAQELGFRVHFVILTDERAQPALRRMEARNAARELGVASERVLFAGLPDAHLRADGTAVRVVRDLVASKGLVPDIVVTHTQADSHNDHVETNRIAHAAFRHCVFLHFSIHVSAEVDRFAPRIFVEVSYSRLKSKYRALSMYRSQVATITRYDLEDYEKNLAGFMQLDRAEGFEVGVQGNALKVFEKTVVLSDSPFHSFWSPILDDQKITYLYGGCRGEHGSGDCGGLDENVGRDLLRQAFLDQWMPSCPLQERCSLGVDVMRVLEAGNVLLSGHPTSNPGVDLLHRRRGGTVAVVEAAKLYAEDPHPLDARDGGQSMQRPKAARSDLGILGRITNPFNPDFCIVSALGTTGAAARAGLEFLANPASQPTLAKEFHSPDDLELLFRVDHNSGELEVIDVWL